MLYTKYTMNIPDEVILCSLMYKSTTDYPLFSLEVSVLICTDVISTSHVCIHCALDILFIYQ